jgi:hypothetical protein
MENRIYAIDRKLEDLRKRWSTASPSMRKWILQGALLLKNEKERLIESDRKKTVARNQERLI